MKEIRSESKLTFFEATSIIVGHGVGSGILSVPFLASRNRWYDILWIILLVYGINLVMHFMIAELSYNNGGAQFIKCFEKELFVGRMKKAATWFAFGLLGFSVVVNVSGFIAGASAVFEAWFGLPSAAGMLLFYVLAASVVYIGMKLVGICEKIAVFSMVGVIGILFIATLLSDVSPLPASFVSASNLLALYSMVSFSFRGDVRAAGGKGAEWGQESDYGFHCGRYGNQCGADPADYLYDASGGGQRGDGKRRAGGSVPSSGRLGEYYRIYFLPAGSCHIFLGQYTEPA